MTVDTGGPAGNVSRGRTVWSFKKYPQRNGNPTSRLCFGETGAGFGKERGCAEASGLKPSLEEVATTKYLSAGGREAAAGGMRHSNIHHREGLGQLNFICFLGRDQ